MLKKNGLSPKDVNVVNLEPQPAANAMIAGTAGIDAAMTYEPYLSAVRDNKTAGKILATTLDYPMVMDTFGSRHVLAENPRAAKLSRLLLRRVAMISADRKDFAIMGATLRPSRRSRHQSTCLADRAATHASCREHASSAGSGRPAWRSASSINARHSKLADTQFSRGAFPPALRRCPPEERPGAGNGPRRPSVSARRVAPSRRSGSGSPSRRLRRAGSRRRSRLRPKHSSPTL